MTTDTPVRKSGILIGRVSRHQFAEDDTAVLVTAKIDANRRIYRRRGLPHRNSLIGIGGDTVLEIVRSPETPRPHARRRRRADPGWRGLQDPTARSSIWNRVSARPWAE